MASTCKPEPVGLRLESRGLNFENGPCDISPRGEFGDSPRDFLLAKLDAPCQRTASKAYRRAKKKKQHRSPLEAENQAPPATNINEPQHTIPSAKNSKDARPVSTKSSPACDETGSNKGGPDDWPEGYTTIMLRNIPVRYTAEELLADFMEFGFEGTFDFFYLPIDFHNKRNRGYGFVNFKSVELTRKFVGIFHRRQLTRYSTQKILEVSPANTQGLEDNFNHYARRDAQRVQNIWFKPMLF